MNISVTYNLDWVYNHCCPVNLELNKENLDLVLSESELIKKDTVSDNKVKNGIIIQLYLLKYKGR
jgi:hypothetical protein